MARIFTDGAERGNISFWDVTSGNFAPTSGIISTNPRSGTYHYYMGSDGNWGCSKNIPDLSEFYFREGFYGTSQGGIILYFRNGTTNTFTLTLDTNRQLTTNIAAAGTSDTVIPESAWVEIEIYYKLADTGGRIHIKVNGQNSGIDYTGDTKPSTQTVINNIYYKGGFIQYFDDLALNDTSGAADNSWCGDGRVIAIQPTSDNGSPQWTGSDADQVDNYALIDELPPSDTDYVRASSADLVDRYNMANPAVSLSGATIKRVWAVARGKSDASPDTVDIGLRTYSTDYLLNVSLPSSFGVLEGTVHTVNPNTSAAWTATEIDDLIAVIQSP